MKTTAAKPKSAASAARRKPAAVKHAGVSVVVNANLAELLDAAFARATAEMGKLVAQQLASAVAGVRPADNSPPLISDVASARLEALITIFSGRSAQQVLQDMLETGNAPSRAQLLRLADDLISRNTGRPA